MQLLNFLTMYVYSSIDSKHSNIAVYQDFSKAFDALLLLTNATQILWSLAWIGSYWWINSYTLASVVYVLHGYFEPLLVLEHNTS